MRVCASNRANGKPWVRYWALAEQREPARRDGPPPELGRAGEPHLGAVGVAGRVTLDGLRDRGRAGNGARACRSRSEMRRPVADERRDVARLAAEVREPDVVRLGEHLLDAAHDARVGGDERVEGPQGVGQLCRRAIQKLRRQGLQPPARGREPLRRPPVSRRDTAERGRGRGATTRCPEPGTTAVRTPTERPSPSPRKRNPRIAASPARTASAAGEPG